MRVGVKARLGEKQTAAGRRFFLIMSILLMVISLTMFTGCGGGGSSDDSDDGSTIQNTPGGGGDDTGTDSDSDSDSSSWDSFDDSDFEDDFDSADYDVPGSGIVDITFNTTYISGATGGASADGTVLTISSAGTYRMTGPLTDGRIIVETEDEEVVRLIFNGIDVACATSAPFYVANAERTAIILADDKDNYLTDPSTYTYFDDAEEEEPNAALHSRDYLTIGVPSGGDGDGTLTVYGNYNDGITSKDGLIINGGTITVTAVDDGIRGKDYLLVKDGTFVVETTDTGDGLLSDEEDDTAKGYILIEKGDFTIDAAEDAIQAETYVVVYDGDFNLTSGGGYTSTMTVDDDSKKGIKGVGGVWIQGGGFDIDSADDAVHSNDFIIVDYGDYFDIATGDDGMHADLVLKIYDGSFDISESYEGIESCEITIDGGVFEIHSDDDGLNCAGGNDGSGFDGGRDGGMPTDDGDYYMYIDGGYIAVYAQGDGLDSNGDIQMTGGTVIIHGPTGDMNGILDSGDAGGTILIDGGFLVGAGSSGMPEYPEESSGQNFKMLTFSQESGGTLFHIESSSGTDIVTFEPSKDYESILISSPDLETGTTYNAYFNGGYSGGTETDGLYEGGTYDDSGDTAGPNFTL